MKEFSYYLKNRLIKKQTPDINLARATANESRDRFLLAKSIFGVQKPKYVVENSYEAVRELIDALLYEKGFKSYSHEGSISYLLELGFSVTEAGILDNLRKKRNSIKYYGGDASEDEAKEALAAAKELISRLSTKSSLFSHII